MANSVDDGRMGWGRLLHGAPLAVLLAALLFILYHLIPILELFVISILLAFVFRSFMYWLGKLGIPHWAGAIIVVLGMLGLAAGIVLFVIPDVIRESGGLVTSLRHTVNSMSGTLGQLHRQYPFLPDISQEISNLGGKMQGSLSHVLGMLPRVVSMTATLLAWGVACLVMFVYMAYDPQSLLRGVRRLIPERHREHYMNLLGLVEDRLRGWVIGTGLNMLAIGVGAVIGLSILQVPMSVTLGILAGLMEVIPFFGSIAGALLPAIIALTISPVKAALVIVLFIILNQLESHIVQPLVIGPRVHLHPVVVIFSLIVAETLLGYVGLLLAMPVAAFIVAVMDELVPEYSPDVKGAREAREARRSRLKRLRQRPQVPPEERSDEPVETGKKP